MKILSSGHSFGEALEELKKGHLVCRAGWNGKGMYLVYIPEWQVVTNKASLLNVTIQYPVLPFIAMKTANETLVPWLASQTDILSNDWDIVISE